MNKAVGLGGPPHRRGLAAMKMGLRRCGRVAAAASLGAVLTPLRRRLRRRCVTVLLYHDPAPEVLDRHLAWFRNRGYALVSLRQFAEAVRRGDRSALPPQSLVLTIDDGWRGNARLLPVLRRHRCPATVFVCAGLVGTRRILWDFVQPACDPGVNAALKAMPNARRLETLRAAFGVTPLDEQPERSMLSHAEMAAMAEWVDFQSHGMFHPLLPRCSDDELEEELLQSRRTLGEITGRPVFAFAYPYGQAGARERRAAAEAGYTLARIAGQDALAAVEGDPHAVPAVEVGDATPVWLLRLHLNWAEMATLMRWRAAEAPGLAVPEAAGRTGA